MILANISPALIGLVDMAVVGHLGDAHYIGAVAVGAVILSFTFTALNFLRMTTTGLAAQAAGAGDAARLRTVLAQACGTALYLGALLLVVQVPLGAFALRLIEPSAAVGATAWDYFAIRIWSAPAALVNFALIGWFVGIGNARAPLAMVLAANLTNIVLDLVLVPGFGLAVRGVAWASLVAEYVGVAIGARLIAKELALRPGHWRRGDILHLRSLHDLFAANAALFLRTLLLMFAFAFLTTMGARQSDAILAANAILVNLQYLMAYVLDGFANAAESLAGRAIGARDRDGLAVIIRECLAATLVIALAIAIVFAVGGPVAIRVVTSLPSVIEAAYTYLPWMVLSPLVCAWAFLYDGVFIGAQRAGAMFGVMLVAVVAVFLPVWWLTRGFGNHGLWFAFTLFNAARGVQQHFLFRGWMRGGRLTEVR
ncbi:MAG: DNA damage-inducible protein F [Steroidobacteraceae bacterium]|nr:DNA damage-inducible protein F [Steroidobacteraceae bacterium]